MKPSDVRRSGSAVLCAALLAFLLPAAPSAAAPSGRPGTVAEGSSTPADPTARALPGRLLVTVVDPAADHDVATVAQAHGGTSRTLTSEVRLVVVPPEVEADTTVALRRLPAVRAVEPDRVRGWARVPNDALFSQQWSHALASTPGAWDHTVGSMDVRVALIDSGVRGDHPELSDNVIEQVDVSNGTPIARGRGVDNDTCEIGHGTQVAGILGAAGDNAMGVAGVAWTVGIVDLAVSSLRTAGTCDGASDSAILTALHYATYHPDGPVDVVNLSVGGRQAYCPEAYARAVDEARREGVVVVAAAGNSGPDSAQVPASCPGVIAVGAIDANGLAASYTASNPWVDLVAPGGDTTDDGGRLWTTSRRGDWTTVRGTSFAAPYVTGAVALLRSVDAGLSPDEIESVLERSADDGGEERTDTRGWGLVQVSRALSWVRRDVSIPPPEPEPYFPVLRLEPLPAGPGPLRLGSEEDVTDPVRLTAEISRTVFREGGAVHAVVARADNFADALAGSALGMGVGPLLFNAPGEELSPLAQRDPPRALPPGARVYVLGGERGLGRGVADELRAMGYGVSRLSGLTREETAVQVAREIARIRRRSGMPPISEVILATRADWPDAVGAGALAARWAVPVLLTEADELHVATRELLSELRPAGITVVGSANRVSDRVALHAQRVAHAERLLRLAGASRHGTMSEVSREVLRRLGTARVAVALNVVRADAYAGALAASVLVGAHGGVFVAMDGDRGHDLSRPAELLLADTLQRRATPADLLGIVVGGTDLITGGGERRLARLLAQ